MAKKYIDAEAAFNEIFKLPPKVDDDGYCWVTRSAVAKRIDSIPAADVVEVVRGKWKWDGFVYDAPWQCSGCGAFSEYESNYCPNCGAKMEVSK